MEINTIFRLGDRVRKMNCKSNEIYIIKTINVTVRNIANGDTDIGIYYSCVPETDTMGYFYFDEEDLLFATSPAPNLTYTTQSVACAALKYNVGDIVSISGIAYEITDRNLALGAYQLGSRITGKRYTIDATHVELMVTHGIQRLDVSENIENTIPKCNHEYVNAGFTSLLMVCKHCGIDRD